MSCCEPSKSNWRTPRLGRVFISLLFLGLQSSIEPVGGQTLASSTPAKEHVYLGDRLLATENQKCHFTFAPLGAVNPGGYVEYVQNLAAVEPTCSWSATRNPASWIDLNSASTGQGTADIRIYIRSTNAGPISEFGAPVKYDIPRSGSVTAGGQKNRFLQGPYYGPEFWFDDMPYGDDRSTSGTCNYLMLMKRYGISNGCGSLTLFCPNDTLTKAQMATFMVRAIEYPNSETFSYGT